MCKYDRDELLLVSSMLYATYRGKGALTCICEAKMLISCVDEDLRVQDSLGDIDEST